jgi:hypothetical protein
VTPSPILATRDHQAQRVAHVLLQLQVAAQEMSRLAREAIVLVSAMSSAADEDPRGIDG